jgi:putative heme iron utilization protein
MTSAAQASRALARGARTATLSTLARDPEGYPYGSLVAVAFDERGSALLLISRLAEHTKNLEARPEASILLTDEAREAGADPLAHGRVTMLGRCVPIDPGPERDAARATFLAAHPEAAQYATLGDFVLHRLEPIALRYIAGFGRMSWITADEYRDAAG